MQALYCDVRQLMTYIKEAHGGVFRRVALSGLLESASHPHRREPNTQTTRVVRYASYEDTKVRDLWMCICAFIGEAY
jgi:hypothetical protein